MRRFVLVGRSKRIFTSGRFDKFLVSARAPSGLCQVDSALGGSVGRGVSLDGRGGGSLVERGGIFRTGAEIPSSTQVDCDVRGWFFSAGSCELAILATQWHAHVMPPCHCVANSVRLAVEYCEIVATGVDFGSMALSKISARGGVFGFASV